MNPVTKSPYMVQMLDRFQRSKTGWQAVREDWKADARYASGDPAQQWDPAVKADRDDEGVPALTFDRLTPMAMSIANAARKERPQPQVMAGDDGDPDTAEVIEGKLRHIQYISRAEIAYNHAELGAIIGGIGFFEIVKEYVTDRPNRRGQMSYDKEPRVCRILDPMSVFYDPAVQEPDFSDAEFCFIRKRYSRDGYRQEFKQEPVSFPFEDPTVKSWGDDKENVWVAKYYWVEHKTHRRITLWDGTEGRKADLEARPDLQEYQVEEGGFPPEYINAERDEEEVIIHCDIVDGEKKLEEYTVSCDWIPVVAVTGTEMVVDGVRRFISAIRYKRNPQQILNATASAVAEALGSASHTEYLGAKGIFKDGKWRDGKRHKYLEFEPKDIYGQPAQPPARDTYEPPIEALTKGMLMAIDGVKAADGYTDNVNRPSQADISGVGVQRRQDQANLSNAHFQMNLVDAQWHGGRILLQMLLRETDTPRKWNVRKEDGTQRVVPVVGGDTDAMVPGMEDQPHFRVDQGEYGLEVTSGPTYAAKAEQEIDTLLEILKANPNMWPIYAPAVFKRLGFQDLAELAEMAMPPQFQQAMQAKAQGMSPREAQLQLQVQQMQAVIQHIAQILQTKQIENDGKIAVENTKVAGQISVEKLKTIRAMIESLQAHSHEAAVEMGRHRVGAAEHLAQMLHEKTTAANEPQETETVQ